MTARSATLLRLLDGLIPTMLVPLPLAVLLNASPFSLLPFALVGWALVRVGRSRTVLDPLGGVPVRMELPPLGFDAWARRVLTEDYARLVRKPPPGHEPATQSRLLPRMLAAVLHVHARKVMPLLGLLLNWLWLPDAVSRRTLDWMAIPTYALAGAAWGYLVGVYLRWRACRLSLGGRLLIG
jgi:hypothetical protein